MIDFCVLGSGIAGSTIANLLSKKYTIEIFDKARGPGGRSSNRRYKKKLSFDHGVQYISPKNKLFKRFVINLKKKNILKIWDGNHIDLNLSSVNSLKYIGKKGNNDIAKFLIKNIRKNFNSPITKINFVNNHWQITSNGKIYHFKNLIMTCPYPQLISLSKNYLNKMIRKLKIQMTPNITTMIVFKKNYDIPISSIKFNNSIITWAANENSKKRFKSKSSLWTIQTDEKFSKKYVNLLKKNKKYISNIIINEFLKLTGLNKKDIIFYNSHGWKYSYNLLGSPIKSYWNKKLKMGICADWFIGSKVESSWLSANDLLKKINN